MLVYLLAALLCCLCASDIVLIAYCYRFLTNRTRLDKHVAAAQVNQRRTARQCAAAAAAGLLSVLLLVNFLNFVQDALQMASGGGSIRAQVLPVAGDWQLGNTTTEPMAVLPPFEPTCFVIHEERVKVRARVKPAIHWC